MELVFSACVRMQMCGSRGWMFSLLVCRTTSADDAMSSPSIRPLLFEFFDHYTMRCVYMDLVRYFGHSDAVYFADSFDVDACGMVVERCFHEVVAMRWIGTSMTHTLHRDKGMSGTLVGVAADVPRQRRSFIRAHVCVLMFMPLWPALSSMSFTSLDSHRQEKVRHAHWGV